MPTAPDVMPLVIQIRVLLSHKNRPQQIRPPSPSLLTQRESPVPLPRIAALAATCPRLSYPAHITSSPTTASASPARETHILFEERRRQRCTMPRDSVQT